MTAFRRVSLAGALALVCALGAASGAAAAVTPGPVTFDVTDAKVGIGPVPSIPINAATLGGQPITLSGTVNAAGTISVPKAGVVFPSIDIPIPAELITTLLSAATGSGGAGSLDIGSLLGGLLGGGTPSAARTAAVAPVTRATPTIDPATILALVGNLSIKAGILPTAPAAGTLDPATGATTLDLGLGLTVGVNGSGIVALFNPIVSCGITPLNFKLTTGTAAVPGKATTLTGKPYDPATGLVTLVGAVESPAPGCKLASILSGLLGTADPLATLGTIPSPGAATVALTGKLTLPAGTPPVTTPPVTTPTTTTPVVTTPKPPVRIATALLKLAKIIKVAGKTVAVKVVCQIVDCTGSVGLFTATSKGASAAKAKKLGSRSFTAKAGKTTTVTVTLSKAARALLKKKRKTKVRVTVSVTGGTAATQTITLTAPTSTTR